MMTILTDDDNNNNENLYSPYNGSILYTTEKKMLKA